MKNGYLILQQFFLWMMCFLGVLHSDEYSEEPKKYQLSICAVFKNEARYLKEWIEYHQLVGVNHFYLYNNNSKDGYQEVLKPYIQKNLVTLIQWPDYLGTLKEEDIFLWSLGTQVPAYENAVKCQAGNETKWLVFVDIDEYLVPPTADTLTEILEKYDEYAGVTLASDFFDAYKIYKFPKRNLLIETTEMISPPYQNPEKGVSKTIFKPDLAKGFIWPPYTCVFKDHKTVKLKKLEMRINHYTNRDDGWFYTGRNKLHIDNRTFSDDEIARLLDGGYAIDDPDGAINRFIPEMLKRMGFDQ